MPLLASARAYGMTAAEMASAASSGTAEGMLGHRIVEHTLFDIRRIGVARRSGRLGDTALLDGDVHDHRAWLHLRDEKSAAASYGERCPAVKAAPTTRSACRAASLTACAVAVARLSFVTPRTRGARRIGRRIARAPRAEHEDIGGCVAERAPSDLHGHPTCDDRHRGQERKAAIRVANGLVGDRRDTALQEPSRMVRMANQAVVSEDHLPRHGARKVALLQFLHLDDHLSVPSVVRIDDACPGASIVVVGEPRAPTCPPS